MTLNSLALALAQGGAEDEAVEHLEQARDVLHALGDEEHEGQVIANLGLVYQRRERRTGIRSLPGGTRSAPTRVEGIPPCDGGLLRAS